MRRGVAVSIALLCLLVAGGLLRAEELGETTYEGEVAPRLQNVGEHQHPITVKGEMGQKFFNQGLNLTYGFNHREAARAYREVARRDPEAAMAYWGHALVLGPNINMPMPPEEEPKAYELVQKAMGLRNKVSQRERDYIEALATRYSGKAEDRDANDRAYAAAMRKLREKYPDDLDAATLYAESLMDLRPWNYWTRDGQPYAETVEILETLESVIERNPNHPGAIHYYIHAVELPRPHLAEAGADRLRTLAPGAGHLVHMPSHIYRRVGRYADASASNVQAIAADEDYITQCRAQGIYPLAYYPHNIHFLWDSATLEGRKQVAVEAARKVGSKVTPEMLKEIPILHTFKVVPLFAYVRFGLWEEALQEPQPPAEQRYWTGIWHYARGTAFMATGRLNEAAAELESLRMIAADKSMEEVPLFSPNNAASVLAIAAEALAGELAAKRGYYDKAVAHLHRAVLLQDALVYIEPPDWHYPVRQSLGAVLLEAGRPVEAEVVYWEDLKRTPENGWSLYGLMKALQAQGKTEQAEAVEKRFQKAWSRSDVKLAASRF
jgi:tetratricopeptide (TPR) repeat protein